MHWKRSQRARFIHCGQYWLHPHPPSPHGRENAEHLPDTQEEERVRGGKDLVYVVAPLNKIRFGTLIRFFYKLR
jgi:hypothetical protein